MNCMVSQNRINIITIFFQIQRSWVRASYVYSDICIYPTRCNVTHFFISGNCSTCFGWCLHPSSGAHTTVSSASGTCQTVTATCHSNGLTDTVVHAPDDGWRYHPKHVEQFPEIKKLHNVASCWMYIYQNIKYYYILCNCWSTLKMWLWWEDNNTQIFSIEIHIVVPVLS